MKGRCLVGMLVMGLALSNVATLAAAEGDKIVRTKSLTSLPVINSICENLLGCTVVGALDVLPGETQPGSLFLVRGLVDNTVTFLLSLLGLAAIEPDVQVTISPETDWGSAQASSHVVDQLYDRVPM